MSALPRSIERHPAAAGPVAPPAGGSAAHTVQPSAWVGGGLRVGEGNDRAPGCPDEGAGRLGGQDSIPWFCAEFPTHVSVGSPTSGLETEKASREGAFPPRSSRPRDPQILILKLEAPGKFVSNLLQELEGLSLSDPGRV